MDLRAFFLCKFDYSALFAITEFIVEKQKYCHTPNENWVSGGRVNQMKTDDLHYFIDDGIFVVIVRELFTKLLLYWTCLCVCVYFLFDLNVNYMFLVCACSTRLVHHHATSVFVITWLILFLHSILLHFNIFVVLCYVCRRSPRHKYTLENTERDRTQKTNIKQTITPPSASTKKHQQQQIRSEKLAFYWLWHKEITLP